MQAIEGSHSVVAAWDGDKLVGLVNALSDGVVTVYFHYMLIHPSYQGVGIGLSECSGF
ncbi:GNAT family N-acetyltransferase [Paenibacillus wynnii]|uniref:GNAT family N-acetyltransferase n=1 Tax=Paenibacillus wynnii TaxID=268407 RepID=UPI0030840D9D